MQECVLVSFMKETDKSKLKKENGSKKESRKVSGKEDRIKKKEDRSKIRFMLSISARGKKRE